MWLWNKKNKDKNGDKIEKLNKFSSKKRKKLMMSIQTGKCNK